MPLQLHLIHCLITLYRLHVSILSYSKGYQGYLYLLNKTNEASQILQKYENTIALCGGIILEEALDLSFDRLRMMMMMMKTEPASEL